MKWQLLFTMGSARVQCVLGGGGRGGLSSAMWDGVGWCFKNCLPCHACFDLAKGASDPCKPAR